jgi:hypothetical protein
MDLTVEEEWNQWEPLSASKSKRGLIFRHSVID